MGLRNKTKRGIDHNEDFVKWEKGLPEERNHFNFRLSVFSISCDLWIGKAKYLLKKIREYKEQKKKKKTV
jgi:hypothetical protein